MSNEHIIRQRILHYGPVKEDPSKTCSPFYITKNVNGWSVRISVDEYAKISVIGWKDLGTLGALGSNSGSEAALKLILDTTSKRVPAIKIVSGSNFHEPKFIEVDDRLDRTTQGFKEQDEYYKREYPASSVLTPEEWFNETIPNYQELLKEKNFNANVAKITEQVSKVQKPYNESWKNAK